MAFPPIHNWVPLQHDSTKGSCCNPPITGKTVLATRLKKPLLDCNSSSSELESSERGSSSDVGFWIEGFGWLTDWIYKGRDITNNNHYAQWRRKRNNNWMIIISVTETLNILGIKELPLSLVTGWNILEHSEKRH